MKAYRRDYCRIADVFKNALAIADDAHGQGEMARIIARDLADVLKSSNDAFDRDRFLHACGVQS